MTHTGGLRYLASCGVLTIPILAWNVAFTRFLPPALSPREFWRDIPPLLAYGENAARLMLIVLPFFMPLEFTTVVQRRGLRLFVIGTGLYFLSWAALMLFPQSPWSTSWEGVLAPAYTPLVWLVGLGLMGRRFFWPVPYRSWAYIGLAGTFVVLHVTHAMIAYRRNY